MENGQSCAKIGAPSCLACQPARYRCAALSAKVDAPVGAPTYFVGTYLEVLSYGLSFLLGKPGSKTCREG